MTTMTEQLIQLQKLNAELDEHHVRLLKENQAMRQLLLNTVLALEDIKNDEDCHQHNQLRDVIVRIETYMRGGPSSVQA